MSIYWQPGDKVSVAPAFFSSLRFFNSINPIVFKQTLQIIGYLTETPLQVLETGTVGTAINTLVFIRLMPLNPLTSDFDSTNSFYNGGLGAIACFDTETLLNDCFKPSAGVIGPSIGGATSIQVINASGIPLSRNTIVRRVGIDPSTQLPLVDLASAANLLTAIPAGMLLGDALPGQSAPALVTGTSPPVNTLGTGAGAPIWLSDLPGGFQTTPGTIGVILGTVLSVAIDGNFYLGGGGIYPTIFQ